MALKKTSNFSHANQRQLETYHVALNLNSYSPQIVPEYETSTRAFKKVKSTNGRAPRTRTYVEFRGQRVDNIMVWITRVSYAALYIEF